MFIYNHHVLSKSYILISILYTQSYPQDFLVFVGESFASSFSFLSLFDSSSESSFIGFNLRRRIPIYFSLTPARWITDDWTNPGGFTFPWKATWLATTGAGFVMFDVRGLFGCTDGWLLGGIKFIGGFWFPSEGFVVPELGTMFGENVWLLFLLTKLS